MKKLNIKTLSLKRNTISNFNIIEIKGGKITWLRAECNTMTCEPSLKCEPVSMETCYYSCVVCDG